MKLVLTKREMVTSSHNKAINEIMDKFFSYSDSHDGDRYDGYLTIDADADNGGIPVTKDFATFKIEDAKSARAALEKAGYTVENVQLTIGDKEKDRRVVFYKFIVKGN